MAWPSRFFRLVASWTGNPAPTRRHLPALRPGNRHLRFQKPLKPRGPGPRAALLSCLLTVFSLAAALPASAQLEEKRITTLTPLDRQYMESQRLLITEMTLRQYGGLCCRTVDELTYLQRLLDDGVVRADQTLELQAMGVVLGDLLASELDMSWVIYEDAQGRSRALRLGETDNFLFPITMISRRREAENLTPVSEIYQGALDAIEAVRPRLPFEAPVE